MASAVQKRVNYGHFHESWKTNNLQDIFLDFNYFHLLKRIFLIVLPVGVFVQSN
jgi:hypothetical protein